MNPAARITLLATRTASILIRWANLSSLRKNDNGDRTSPHSAMAMMLGAFADKGEAPPQDAEQRIVAHLVKTLTAKYNERQHVYFSLDVDYGPGHELAELSIACDLCVSWPIKSHMTITLSENEPGQISESQGYAAPSVVSAIVPEREAWLITNRFSVEPLIRAIVVDAVKAGNTVAMIEGFAPAIE
jgi:hypothetical protein